MDENFHVRVKKHGLCRGPRLALYDAMAMFGHRGLIRTVLVTIIMLSISAGLARAQIDNRLAAGLTAGFASARGGDGGPEVNFEMRIGHERAGWGPQIALFNWFDTGLHQPTATRTVDFGNLRARPMMAGYGYTWLRGRATLTADLLAGYSVNSFALDPAAEADYAQRLGATRVDSTATNAFAVKPEFQMWYDLNGRFGLKLTGGYLVSRPSIVIRSSLGEDVRPIHADRFLLTIGAVYSIF
jgi:hypothetical protein